MLLPGCARESLDSGSARDSPASCAGFREVPGSCDDSGGGAALRGLGWAEEVEPEVFPVPVSVRGPAAAAAGAAMPKGGEGRARGPRASRGRSSPVPAVHSTRGSLGERRKGGTSAPAEVQAWASAPNCPDGETEDHSGLEPLPRIGHRRPVLGSASPGLEGLKLLSF